MTNTNNGDRSRFDMELAAEGDNAPDAMDCPHRRRHMIESDMAAIDTPPPAQPRRVAGSKPKVRPKTPAIA